MRVHPAVPLATEDFTFQGVDIPVGTHVALFLAAANTETDTFGDALFDITAQLTFGGGIPPLPRRVADPTRDATDPGVPAP